MRLLRGLHCTVAVQAMQEAAAAGHSEPSQQLRAAPNAGEAAAALAWNPWRHNPQLWVRGGRLARELHDEAVKKCKVGAPPGYLRVLVVHAGWFGARRCHASSLGG